MNPANPLQASDADAPTVLGPWVARGANGMVAIGCVITVLCFAWLFTRDMAGMLIMVVVTLIMGGACALRADEGNHLKVLLKYQERHSQE